MARGRQRELDRTTRAITAPLLEADLTGRLDQSLGGVLDGSLVNRLPNPYGSWLENC
jgi:hypothetical protein